MGQLLKTVMVMGAVQWVCCPFQWASDAHSMKRVWWWGVLSCHMTKGDRKWVHVPWDHELEDEHVGVWGGQRNGWSERPCSAFRGARGQSSCVLAADFSLTSNHRTD